MYIPSYLFLNIKFQQYHHGDTDRLNFGRNERRGVGENPNHNLQERNRVNSYGGNKKLFKAFFDHKGGVSNNTSRGAKKKFNIASKLKPINQRTQHNHNTPELR